MTAAPRVTGLTALAERIERSPIGCLAATRF